MTVQNSNLLKAQNLLRRNLYDKEKKAQRRAECSVALIASFTELDEFQGSKGSPWKVKKDDAPGDGDSVAVSLIQTIRSDELVKRPGRTMTEESTEETILVAISDKQCELVMCSYDHGPRKAVFPFAERSADQVAADIMQQVVNEVARVE